MEIQKVSFIYISQCIQQLTIRSSFMKYHEMSLDNTVFNFTETAHVIVHSFWK